MLMELAIIFMGSSIAAAMLVFMGTVQTAMIRMNVPSQVYRHVIPEPCANPPLRCMCRWLQLNTTVVTMNACIIVIVMHTAPTDMATLTAHVTMVTRYSQNLYILKLR